MKQAFIVFLVLTACDPKEQKLVNGEVVNHAKKEMVFTTPPVELSIDTLYEIEDGHLDLKLDERTLFGKFYRDRVSFYVVEQPNLTLYGAPVESMTLYLIDSVLCRKKYELTANIAEPLIEQLGKFVFKPLDWNTIESAKVVDVVLRNDDMFQINPIMNRYQLRWETDNKTILFRHEHDSTSERNVYEEQLSEYKRLMRSLD